MAPVALDNDAVADRLEEVADLLAAQSANPFRIRAWREAARTVRGLARDLADLATAEGRDGLEKLSGVGESLASAIEELVTSGRLALLDRLRGEVSPEDLFARVPGIGETLASRIHAALGVETLEELELAAHDGRLAGVPGFGARRVRQVRDSLDAALRRSSRRGARLVPAAETAPARPEVGTILAVDARYRDLAAKGELRRIAPRRFNPDGRAWLPVLHEDRDGWSFTALYSNTARAHELGKTDDWVVVYAERDGHESQCTVVTETRGRLLGRRVVRGREQECARLDSGG